MGYSKYTEDIEKIHSFNIFGTSLDWQPRAVSPLHRCDFCTFETRDREERDAHILKEHRDAAIYLEYDGHIIPARAVFKVRPIHLKIRCPALPAGITVTISSSSNKPLGRRFKDGALLNITPPDEEVVTLHLGVGAYRREYSISFRHQAFSARLTPSLMTRLKSANSSIANWQWHDVGQLKAALLCEPSLSEDETVHRHGIFEYYHALWLEQQHKPEHANHFEEAFNSLRNFTDPLAQLVVSYFLYRVNSFETISPLIPFPQLRRVVAFFAGPYDRPHGSENGKLKCPDEEDIFSCEISIADADQSVFSAVSAIEASNWEAAEQACALAETTLWPGDDQALYRILFLRYRLNRLRGHLDAGRRLAERLKVCNVKSFQSEAKEFLRNF